jgi:hypothetical protein
MTARWPIPALLFFAVLAPARAQINVGLEIKRPIAHIRHEPVVATVKITNLSGATCCS